MEAVAVHLDRCTECRALADRASAARAVLADLRVEQARLPVPDLWSGVRDRLQAEGLLGPAADSPARVETAAGTVLPFRGRGLAAAAAVIIGIALWRGQLAPPGTTEPGLTTPTTTTTTTAAVVRTEPVPTALEPAGPVATPVATPAALAQPARDVAFAQEPAGAGHLERLAPGSEHLIESARIFRPEEMVLRQGTGEGPTLASSPMRILRRRMH